MILENKKVSIIIANYNCKKYVDMCLMSLADKTHKNHEVIVVDNLSEDDSAEYIERNYPDVTLIKLYENIGFGAASNVGAKYAIDRGTDFILFLNFDTKADRDMLEVMLQYADALTVVTPWIYNDVDRTCSWYAGGYLDISTLWTKQTIFDGHTLREAKEVNFISGCCMMVAPEILSKTGFFDEDYFLYFEDTELCVRLAENNIRMLYVPFTALYHATGGSQVRTGEMYYARYYMVRNRLMLAEKHKNFLNCSPMSILRIILEERSYFQCNEKYVIDSYVNYEKKAIEDFLQGKVGRCEVLCIENGKNFMLKRGRTDSWSAVGEDAFLYIANYSDANVMGYLSFQLGGELGKTEIKVLCGENELYSGCAQNYRYKFAINLREKERAKLEIKAIDSSQMLYPKLWRISLNQSAAGHVGPIKLAVYGTGILGQRFWDTWTVYQQKVLENVICHGQHEIEQYEIVYFVETDPGKETFHGLPVISAREMDFDEFEYLIIAAGKADEILRYLREINKIANIDPKRIWKGFDFIGILL